MNSDVVDSLGGSSSSSTSNPSKNPQLNIHKPPKNPKDTTITENFARSTGGSSSNSPNRLSSGFTAKAPAVPFNEKKKKKKEGKLTARTKQSDDRVIYEWMIAPFDGVVLDFYYRLHGGYPSKSIDCYWAFIPSDVQYLDPSGDQIVPTSLEFEEAINHTVESFIKSEEAFLESSPVQSNHASSPEDLEAFNARKLTLSRMKHSVFTYFPKYKVFCVLPTEQGDSDHEFNELLSFQNEWYSHQTFKSKDGSLTFTLERWIPTCDPDQLFVIRFVIDLFTNRMDPFELLRNFFPNQDPTKYQILYQSKMIVDTKNKIMGHIDMLIENTTGVFPNAYGFGGAFCQIINPVPYCRYCKQYGHARPKCTAAPACIICFQTTHHHHNCRNKKMVRTDPS